HGNSTKITVLDISEFAHPRTVEELYLPGSYNTSRRIGSSVRVVLSDGFHWPREVKWWPDYDSSLYQDEERLARAFDELIASNTIIIRRHPLNAWLPAATRKLADGSTVELSYDCSEFSRSNAPTRLGIVSIATLDLQNPDHLRRSTIVADPGPVYASPTALYV